MDGPYLFRAMGTSFEVHGPADHPLLGRARACAEARVIREDRRFSRFRPDSELTAVNVASGSQTRVSGPFATVLRLALDAAAESGGRFDPTVHDALLAAGYDRDFDEVLAGARGTLHPASPCGRWSEIHLDGRSLRLPPGVHLDFGGIAKGWTADRAAEDALAQGIPWVMVNAGGDLRIVGAAPTIDVAIDDPLQPDETVARVRLADGALATSSIVKRSWGDGLHHVIDPFTGAPATTEALQVTVWAPTCARAEVLATDALLQGRDALRRIPGVLVRAGEVIVSMPLEGEAAA